MAPRLKLARFAQRADREERTSAAQPELLPDWGLARSHPSDVGRVEHLTFICTPQKDDAGLNYRGMAPAEAHAKMDSLFDGCMKGRTPYGVPYCMGSY